MREPIAILYTAPYPSPPSSACSSHSTSSPLHFSLPVPHSTPPPALRAAFRTCTAIAQHASFFFSLFHELGSVLLRGLSENVPIFHRFDPSSASLGLSEVAEGFSGRLGVWYPCGYELVAWYGRLHTRLVLRRSLTSLCPPAPSPRATATQGASSSKGTKGPRPRARNAR